MSPHPHPNIGPQPLLKSPGTLQLSSHETPGKIGQLLKAGLVLGRCHITLSKLYKLLRLRMPKALREVSLKKLLTKELPTQWLVG